MRKNSKGKRNRIYFWNVLVNRIKKKKKRNNWKKWAAMSRSTTRRKYARIVNLKEKRKIKFNKDHLFYWLSAQIRNQTNNVKLTIKNRPRLPSIKNLN